MLKSDEIQDRLREADKSFNAHVISLAIVDMMREDPNLTFADFETALRAIDSDTYLIARPNHIKPHVKPHDLDVVWFNDREGNPTHHLWICLHGEEEQSDELGIADMTVADNLDALKKTCGVLAMKRPS